MPDNVKPSRMLLRLEAEIAAAPTSLEADCKRAERAAYFTWRLAQGNWRRGLKTRWRRLRGVYSTAEVVDFEDYHVVRGGVDSEAIVKHLEERFSRVEVVCYWSTYARPLQRLGERMHLVSSFGILASGCKQG